VTTFSLHFSEEICLLFTVGGNSEFAPELVVDMAAPLRCVLHFVLIHGAFHGAWAWYRLEDQLQKAGHKVTSMDMTGAGINLADPDTITTWEEYHKPALDFFQSLPEPAPNEKVTS
jgi:hypothetical protein